MRAYFKHYFLRGKSINETEKSSQNTLETKSQVKMWTGTGESAPKKVKTVPLAGTVMATIFWDSHGIILIDYLQKGKTITGEY